MGFVRRLSLLGLSLLGSSAFASEADLKIPDLNVMLDVMGSPTAGTTILWSGIGVCVFGMLFGLYEFMKIKSLPAHKSLLDISDLIYQTCKTYMIQQGKFLVALEILIGGAMVYYFAILRHMEFTNVLLILAWSVMGILGSYM